jgi:hypothetical protein
MEFNPALRHVDFMPFAVFSSFDVSPATGHFQRSEIQILIDDVRLGHSRVPERFGISRWRVNHERRIGNWLRTIGST